MKRVMIVGQPGSGKSTLARDLGKLTGLPVVHVDMIHWMPGWEERDRNDKIALATAEEAKDAWIFEGGLSATWPNRLRRADTLVVLDLPLSLRAWRVFRRTLRDHGSTRPDLPDNFPERFDPEFWHYIWRTRNTAKVKMRALIPEADDETAVFHLTSRRAIRTFVMDLSAGV